MKNFSRRLILLIFLSLLIGLYPLLYIFVDSNFGLLTSKSNDLLSDSLWRLAFYGHILPGGLALMVGSFQFSQYIRIQYVSLHRKLGYIYTVAVFVSAASAIYLSFHASGGWISGMGFFTLAIIWLFTTSKAFYHVKHNRIVKHQRYMQYSFAACFAAVTLRLWLPILITVTGDFNTAYRVVAWLCWMPNLIFIKFFVKH